MFKLQDDLKAEDGYHVVELHSQDEEFAKILLEAMKVKGYDVYGFSDRGGSKQYAFVTAEFAEVLKERHMHSCRNSAGGIFELPTEAKKVDPQVIGRAFRTPTGCEVEIIDIKFRPDHQLDPLLLPPGIDAEDATTYGHRPKSVEVDLQERGIGSRIMGSQAEGIQPIRDMGDDFPIPSNACIEVDQPGSRNE
jgi:hypothetical protein